MRQQEGVGLEVLTGIGGKQFEELSELVMRRWVLMMRLLERGVCKRVKDEKIGARM